VERVKQLLAGQVKGGHATQETCPAGGVGERLTVLQGSSILENAPARIGGKRT
jgi:hypothetical protein